MERKGGKRLPPSAMIYLVFIRKRPFSAVAASIRRLACAAYRCTPPRNPLISLPQRKIARFPYENYAGIHPEFPDGYYLWMFKDHALYRNTFDLFELFGEFLDFYGFADHFQKNQAEPRAEISCNFMQSDAGFNVATIIGQ
jgi:hypothetical protein